MESSEGKSIGYMFHTGSTALTFCEVGGVVIQAIIDSGAGANMITKETWEHMKKNHVVIKDQKLGTDRNFFAYGQVPIEVIGNFEAKIEIGQSAVVAKFYVVMHAKQNLLSKETSEKLGVLKVLSINQVDEELKAFPKVI